MLKPSQNISKSKFMKRTIQFLAARGLHGRHSQLQWKQPRSETEEISSRDPWKSWGNQKEITGKTGKTGKITVLAMAISCNCLFQWDHAFINGLLFKHISGQVPWLCPRVNLYKRRGKLMGTVRLEHDWSNQWFKWSATVFKSFNFATLRYT